MWDAILSYAVLQIELTCIKSAIKGKDLNSNSGGSVGGGSHVSAEPAMMDWLLKQKYCLCAPPVLRYLYFSSAT